MTPEQIAIINTVAVIMDKIGTWPVGTLFFMAIFGPWVMMYFLARGQEKRLEAVTEMYENNVELVKGYEQVAKVLFDTVVLGTQTMTEVKDIAENNLFCPLLKQQGKKTEVSG